MLVPYKDVYIPNSMGKYLIFIRQGSRQCTLLHTFLLHWLHVAKPQKITCVANNLVLVFLNRSMQVELSYGMIPLGVVSLPCMYTQQSEPTRVGSI